jgi:hypothetical protein
MGMLEILTKVFVAVLSLMAFWRQNSLLFGRPLFIFYFLVVLEFELRVSHLSHSTSPISVKDFSR